MKTSDAVSKRDWHRSGTFFLSIVLGWATICRAGSCQSAGAGSAPNTTATRPRVFIFQPRLRIIGASDGRNLEAASDTVETGFLGVVSRAFEEKGYILRFDPASVVEQEANSLAIKALLDDYDSRFCPLPNSLAPDPTCPMPKKASLEDDLIKIEEINETDLVVLTHGKGEVRTLSKAMTAVGQVVGGGYPTDLEFRIEIVDVKTGLSIYNCAASAGDDYVGATESQLSGPIQKCLENYFNSSPKRHQVIGIGPH
jgi:hypothetical protein